MLISKKELLRETGISYGQLYRWKRERLIPEDWFIKQSSFTGQETFFPRERILARIRSIQQLKERYSLEELARLLSPELAERYFTPLDLRLIEEIPDPGPFLRGFGKEVFIFGEVMVMVALQRLAGPVGEGLEGLAAGLRDPCAGLTSLEYVLEILSDGSRCYGFLYPESAAFAADARLQSLGQVRLSEAASAFKLKYSKKFNFQFDEPQEG